MSSASLRLFVERYVIIFAFSQARAKFMSSHQALSIQNVADSLPPYDLFAFRLCSISTSRYLRCLSLTLRLPEKARIRK